HRFADRQVAFWAKPVRQGVTRPAGPRGTETSSHTHSPKLAYSVRPRQHTGGIHQPGRSTSSKSRIQIWFLPITSAQPVSTMLSGRSLSLASTAIKWVSGTRRMFSVRSLVGISASPLFSVLSWPAVPAGGRPQSKLLILGGDQSPYAPPRAGQVVPPLRC